MKFDYPPKINPESKPNSFQDFLLKCKNLLNSKGLVMAAALFASTFMAEGQSRENGIPVSPEEYKTEISKINKFFDNAEQKLTSSSQSKDTVSKSLASKLTIENTQELGEIMTYADTLKNEHFITTLQMKDGEVNVMQHRGGDTTIVYNLSPNSISEHLFVGQKEQAQTKNPSQVIMRMEGVLHVVELKIKHPQVQSGGTEMVKN